MSVATPTDHGAESSLTEPPEINPTILERVASGERDAIEECIEQYGRLVWSLARRLSASVADAEDATQEIFTEVWRRAGNFDPKLGGESTFITLIARRRLIDRMRSTNRRPEASGSQLDEIDIAEPLEGDKVELEEEAAKARQCMQRLSQEQKQILTMSIHHGLTQSSIAEKLAMPLGTVKTCARRALVQLRDCMLRRQTATEGMAR